MGKTKRERLIAVLFSSQTSNPVLRCSRRLDYTLGRHICFVLLPPSQNVWLLLPVVPVFISLQSLSKQYCPLAEELLAAEKGEVLLVPAVL